MPLVYQPGTDDEPIFGSTVWTGGDGGWQFFLTSDGEGTVDGGVTEDEPQGEPFPLRWLGGTGYSQFRSMGEPGWGDDIPVFRPSDVDAAKQLTGLAKMIHDHGAPVSVREGDSDGRVLIYSFADGTSYMEPVEPPSEQYIDSAAAVLPGAIAFRGGKGALGASRAIAAEAIEDAIANRASQAADDASGGRLGSMSGPLLPIILGARPKLKPGVLDDAADAAKNAGSAVARGVDDAGSSLQSKPQSSPRVLEVPVTSARYVYDAKAGRYRDVATGQFVAAKDLPWPGNGGFAGSSRQTVPEGIVLDRFGKPTGRFLGEPGTTISQRGMAPGTEAMTYTKYKVLKPFDAQVGPAAAVPEFGATGGAVQYLSGRTIQWLLDNQFIEVVE